MADGLLKGFTTHIWMQLKPNCDRQKLEEQIASLDPFMLLNLRRLR
jgi:hypothetical protein